MSAPEQYLQLVNEIAFAVAILMTVVFYAEYKKCENKIERDELLDQFLNKK